MADEGTSATMTEAAPGATPNAASAGAPDPMLKVFNELATPLPGEAEADAALKAADTAMSGKPEAAATKEQAKPASTPEERTKIVLAKQALARQGFHTKEEIDAIPVARLLELGEKAQKKHEHDQKAWDFYNKHGKPGKPAKPDSGGDTTADPRDLDGRSDEADPAETAPEAPEVDGDIEQIIKSEALDEKAANRLRGVTRRTNELLEAADRELERAHTLVATTRLRSAKDALLKEFPGLKDQAKFTQVLAWMKRYDTNHRVVLGEDDNAVTQFMRDAAWAVIGPEIETTVRQDLIAGNRKDLDGQPEQAGVVTSTKPLTGAALDAAIGKAAVMAGSDDAKFRKMLADIAPDHPYLKS